MDNVSLNPVKAVPEAFLPSDHLVGGSIPVIEGREDEIVYHAAVQACGTEDVHYCYSVDEGRCWYLAVKSSALASNPHSWCPLAAALPGNSQHHGKDIIHVFEQNCSAGALYWERDSGRMHLYFGSARLILPKIQSFDKKFVTVDVTEAVPVAWKNLQIKKDFAAHEAVKKFFTAGLLVLLIVMFLDLAVYLYAGNIKSKITPQPVAAFNLDNASVDRHLTRIIELLYQIEAMHGVLTRYEFNPAGQVEWEALIPEKTNYDILRGEISGIEGGRIKIRGTQ